MTTLAPDSDTPYRPAVGDLVALPPYLPQYAMFVRAVADSPVPHRIRIAGDLIREGGRREPADYDVPVGQVDQLVDDQCRTS